MKVNMSAMLWASLLTGAVNGTDLPGAIARFGELSYESLRSNEVEIAVMKLV